METDKMPPTKTLHEIVQEGDVSFRDFADHQKDPFNHNLKSTINQQTKAASPSFQLDPVDQEVLEATGELPGLPLLVHPETLRRLAAPPPSVHTIETTGRNHPSTVESPLTHESDGIDPDSEPREDYTFRGYLLRTRRPEYARAVEVYAEVDGSIGGKFSSRLKECRRHAWFVQHKVNKTLRVMSSRCKLRWCPICRDVSRRIVTTAVDEWLQVQKYPKMITLTLLHSDDPLQLQIKRIYDCFRKLRRRAYFQRLVTGGVWFFQLKFNQQEQQWHPHIHCLVAGAFLPHARLKSLWHKITGDSYVVDIRPVKDLENASTEVARYATSPADLSAVDLEKAIDIYYATKGRRICGSWGSAKSVTMKPTVQDDRDEWIRVADFYFVNVQKEYNTTAKSFWFCYKTGKPYEGPQLQPDVDIYAEELNILLSLEDLPKNDREWHMRIQRNRSGPWTKHFYDTVN